MRSNKSRIFWPLNAAWFGLLLFVSIGSSQSTDPNFPTPLTNNEIIGAIKARDIGDSRLTSYYFVFEGVQGDIFINVVTKNFNGDIDVFNQSGLQPLTKMVIYADASPNETGRLIYLRKPERLVLRVQGRTPNDDPATFRVKFAGSFVAMANKKTNDAPTLEEIGPDDSSVRVNSVGTRIPVLPKPSPSPIVTESEVNGRSSSEQNAGIEIEKKEERKPPAEISEKKVEIVVQDPLPTTVDAKRENLPVSTSAKPNAASRKATPKNKATPAAEESKPDPLASIRLVVLLKDGTLIERPMSEIQRFSVDKGMLVVVAKDGSTVRHSILNVAKVTIE